MRCGGISEDCRAYLVVEEVSSVNGNDSDFVVTALVAGTDSRSVYSYGILHVLRSATRFRSTILKCPRCV